MVHQMNTQRQMDEQLDVFRRLVGVAEEQVQLAKRAERSSFWTAIGAIAVAVCSLAVAVVAVVLNAS